MSADVALPAVHVRATERTRPAEVAIARRAFRQVWKGTLVWALVFVASVSSTALAYVGTYPSEASRAQAAAAVANDRAMAILLGPISAIDSVGGYTAYKLFVTLTSIAALWGLFGATRLLRGEEDAGRWQLVLAGTTRPGRATGATLAALFTAVTILFLGTMVGAMLAGRDPAVAFDVRSDVLYGLSIALVPAVFIGVGAFTSQLARTRRRATGLGMGVFALAFVLRMIADASDSTQWLLWTTPFGWSELMRPFTVDDPWPLVPALVATIALSVAAVMLSSRRDVGDGVIGSPDVAELRPRGLRSATGLATRLELPVLTGWFVGVVAAALSLGLFAEITTQPLPDSFNDTLSKFGVQGAFTDQFFAISFIFIVTMLALIPASQLSAAADEETSGRLVHVLSRPITRASWFGGRLLVTAVAIVVSGVASGVAVWAGAASQGVEVDVGRMLYAGVNCLPVALLSLGIGAVAFAVAPRSAAPAVYAVITWSVVVYLFSSLFTSLRSLEQLSLFTHMAAAPAQDPDPGTLLITTAIAVALCVLGTFLATRRDVRVP